MTLRRRSNTTSTCSASAATVNRSSNYDPVKITASEWNCHINKHSQYSFCAFKLVSHVGPCTVTGVCLLIDVWIGRTERTASKGHELCNMAVWVHRGLQQGQDDEGWRITLRNYINYAVCVLRMAHGISDVTVEREKRRGKCGDVRIRKCDAVRRGYTWNCTYCPRVFLPITSGKRPEQKDTLRSVLGENIWQSSVGSDMPPSVTPELLLL